MPMTDAELGRRVREIFASRYNAQYKTHLVFLLEGELAEKKAAIPPVAPAPAPESEESAAPPAPLADEKPKATESEKKARPKKKG